MSESAQKLQKALEDLAQARKESKADEEALRESIRNAPPPEPSSNDLDEMRRAKLAARIDAAAKKAEEAHGPDGPYWLDNN